MRSVLRTLIIAAVLVAVSGFSASAHEVGDLVVATSDTPLKVKEVVVDTISRGDVVTVERVADKWLWVSLSSGKKGWVKAEAVVPYEENAPDAPSDESTPPELPEEPLNPEVDRLVMIGTLGSAHVYTTYAYIGVLADGLGKELYSVEQTTTLLGEVVSVSNNIVRNLKRVRDGGLSDADAEAINNMIDIYGLLQEEASAAIAFAESRTVEDAQEFDQARTAVWPMISELLGLDAEPVSESE